MDDKNVLQHLLGLESQAAALVNDAQAEADRRIAEGEKQNRARYDEAYAREAAALEASYTEKLAAVKADYHNQLRSYEEGLKTQPLNITSFTSLAGKYLLSATPFSKEG